MRILQNFPRAYETDYLFTFLLAPVFTAVLIFTSLIWASADSYNTVADRDQNLALLHRFLEDEKDADVSVIMLGNSRLRHALNFGYDPSGTVRLPDGRMLAALQFSDNASEYRVYEYMESDILLIHPDILVILDTLLSNRSRPYSWATRYGRMAYDLFENRLNGTARRLKTRAERQDLMKRCYSSFNAVQMNERVKSTAWRDAHSLDMDVNGRNLEGIRRLVDLAVKAGIRVVIVSLPPNMAVLDRYHVPSHVLDFYGLGFQPRHEQLLPDLADKVTWLPYNAPHDSAYYCDFVHLNSQGRAQSEEWFLDNIARLTK